MSHTTSRSTRFAASFLTAAVLSIPAAIIGTTPAHAAPQAPTVTAQAATKVAAPHRWTKHDKKVMKAANKTCAKITDDVTWEFCVVGAFHLGDADGSSRRVITVDDYRINSKGQIVLVQL